MSELETNVEYAWAKNMSICKRGAPAKDVAGALQAIESTHEVLTPTLVLEAARDTRSALHACFEWSDSVAAEKFRIEQARELIRSVRVQYVGPTGEPGEPKRVYINLDGVDTTGRSYVAIARVVTNRELFMKAKEQFLRESDALEARYREFESIAALVAQMRGEAEALSA